MHKLHRNIALELHCAIKNLFVVYSSKQTNKPSSERNTSTPDVMLTEAANTNHFL